ncbi:hypothetical protein QOT17_007898 [Balamuthia mandrillaris]
MSESDFEIANEQQLPGDILTSSARGIRQRFKHLEKKNGSFKGMVSKHMKDLFGIHSLRLGEESGLPTVNFIISEGDHETEIIHTGEALRKVFTSLVLFFTLVATEEQERVFLVEEPEAHLYSSLQKSFAELLLRLAKEHHVQLFLTTNSNIFLEAVKLFVSGYTACSSLKNHNMLRLK